jgi:RimJ/RimL family protein N-acetyltransferase
MTTVPDITFRPITPADLPMLREWLQRPHVAEWWGAPESLDELRAEFDPRPDNPVRGYIAYEGEAPIGFAQSYVAVLCHADGWWLDEHDPGVVGIDQFLADAQRLGQGLGTRMVRAFVDRLFESPGVTRVQTDPDPSNARAIRCYEKAGFRRVREMVTSDGPALLMYLDRPA